MEQSEDGMEQSIINKKIYEYFYHATIDCDLVSFFYTT